MEAKGAVNEAKGTVENLYGRAKDAVRDAADHGGVDSNRVSGAAKEFGGKVQGAMGSLVGDSETQARGKANEVEGSVENLYGQAKDAVRDVAEQAGDLARDALKQGRERYPDAERAYRQSADTVSQYAKEAPLMVAIMAGAIGYLLALVIHGRR
ncbi:CsbD family protein [Methylobacterium terricola]|uniref:CsbD family protein n=2 Tax=Methylobacterium terricola TaxID=2583531 RepID=A0A5C4L7W2_9HYPH|nr:CsbD family protein [Methylobacterium terricola]